MSFRGSRCFEKLLAIPYAPNEDSKRTGSKTPAVGRSSERSAVTMKNASETSFIFKKGCALSLRAPRHGLLIISLASRSFARRSSPAQECVRGCLYTCKHYHLHDE